MNYGSFYGGRKGTSFVIVKSYPDVISMVNQFQLGPDFGEVEYDEYVLINTVNKNHPDNGKLYRRGYDYNSTRTISGYRAYKDAAHTIEIINGSEEDYQNAYYDFDTSILAGGAEYIGTIVGPPGRAPHLSIQSYDQIQNRQVQQGYSVVNKQGSFSLPNNDLLPGKYVENGVTKYNDEIKWYSVSIRNTNNEDSDAIVGFQVPYPVIDFITEKISSYNEQGEVTDNSKAERVDSGEYHPFYEKWKLFIPQGVKGDALKKLRVVRFQDLPNTKIFINEFNYYYYDDDQAKFFYGTEGGQTEDTEVSTTNDKFSFQIGNLTYTIQANTQIMVCDEYNYETYKNPQVPEKIYFIGILNQIMQDSFEIANNGDIHIDFTDGTFFDKKGFFKKISNVQIIEDVDDSNKLKLNIYFNTQDSQGNNQKFSYILKLIKNIEIEDDGTINISYTDGSSLIKDKYLTAITDVRLQDNKLRIFLNNEDEPVEYDITWVSDFRINDIGEVLLKHNGNEDFDKDQEGNYLPLQTIRWIDSINYNRAENKTVITYNTGEQTEFENVFRSITDAFIDSDTNQFVVRYNTVDENGQMEQDVFSLSGSLITGVDFIKPGTGTTSEEIEKEGKFIVHYTGKEDDEFELDYPSIVEFNNTNPKNDDYKLKIKTPSGDSILESDPIDSLYDIQITSDHHLVALFSSQDTRNKIGEENRAYSESLVSQRDGQRYENWLDLGSVFTDSGILIGLNLNHIDFGYSDTEEDREAFAQLSISDIINQLNTRYTNGVVGDDYLEGKIITVGLPGVKKDFYAFNYDYDNSGEYKGWYFLGSIETAAHGQMDCKMGTQNEMPSNLENVIEDGLYFIVEE